MKRLIKSFLPAFLLSCLVSPTVFARGEISVEQPSGDVDTYPDVEISNTNDILYFKASDSNTILMVTKKDCKPEDKIWVCNQARMGVDTNGIIEELNVKQIVLFINPTAERQPVKGSSVTMGPGTVLLEAATAKGAYVTGLGKIDGTTKPAGASK